MRRFLLALFLFAAAIGTAQAQTLTPGNYVIGSGGSTTFALNGTAGAQFALISSSTNNGFSYAGVSLFAGTDVQIVGVGVLDGAGQASVPFTPPFPARDRIYVQAVFTNNGFASITPSNGVVLVNNQVGSLFMPLGGVVSSTGTLNFGSPGVTVTKAGSVYTIAYPGTMQLPNVIPSVTVLGSATVTSISTNFSQMVVTLSADAGFIFSVQPIRR
ncbi:MAG: hypothetical protein U0P30_17035 [Vicinamibacterales bacterium]